MKTISHLLLPARALLLCIALALSFVAESSGANPVQTENAKPGTNSWQLTNPATNREIEGYASLTSVNRGGQISFFVNTADANYTIEIFRLGWYGGTGSRRLAGPITLAGTRQAIPTPDPTTGFLECNWINPYVLTVPANAGDPTDWASGIYLAKLTGGTSGKQSYIIFAVRDDARVSDHLYQLSVTTFQAYNNWGGKSVYGFNSTNGSAARKVSFNRPYAVGLNPDAAYGVGTGDFLTNAQAEDEAYGAGWEINMVRFLEREGYDVTYCTNIDTHNNANLLLSHKGFLSVGHDEYWTWQMRANIEAARDRGVGLGFFGANICYWQIRLEPSPATGAAARTMVSYKSAAATQDPFATDGDPNNNHLVTGRFRDQPINFPEDELLGVLYEWDPVNADIVVDDASSWIFAGTGLRNGDRLIGLLGYEADRILGGAPVGTARVGHSPYQTSEGVKFSSMVTYTAASGATVFSTGSIQWSWGLDDFGVGKVRPSLLSPAAQQITRNVLASFIGQKPAGTAAPVPTLVFSDDFNDNSRDTAKWNFGTIQGALYAGSAAWDASLPVREQNQRLEISPLANASGNHYNGYVAVAGRNLTNSRASVQAIQTASGGATHTAFALCVDSQNFYMMSVESGWLNLEQIVAGVRSGLAIPYNPSAHRYWAIRHDVPNDLIVFETSTDRQIWTPRHELPRRLAITALKAELSAGTWQPISAPGTAIFDNFRLETDAAVSSNRAPLANAGIPYHGVPGQAITFDGSASTDPDGTISSYQWSFGDGTTGSGVRPTRAYAAPGVYTVALTVTDNGGATNRILNIAIIEGAAPGTGTFSDDFNDNSRDTTKWKLGTVQGQIYSGSAGQDLAIPVLERNQRLEITPRTGVSGDHYNGYVSAATWNLTNAAVSVEVLQVAGGGFTDTELAVCADSRNFFMMLVEGGTLYCDAAVGGGRTVTSVPYNASQHRFWRIRHVQSNDSIVYETSPDRSTWTVRRSIARPFGITVMQVELSAGTYQAESATGTAIFDNFRLETNSTTPSNQPPVARPGGPYSGTAGTAVQLSGATSSDPDGTISSYQWNFGDGTSGTGATVSHVYAAAGTYTVQLTVTDNSGATATATTTATITNSASVNAAQFVSQSVPTQMQRGKTYNVFVTMKNTGTTTWTQTAGYQLGSLNPQNNMTWGKNRIALPASVAPGANVTFSFSVTAPATKGAYNFQWGMVQDGGIGSFGSAATNVRVTVK